MKRAPTTKISPSLFLQLSDTTTMIGTETKPLVHKCAPTCGSHGSSEPTWMTLPGIDLFAAVPFYVVHIILEKGTVL